MRHSRRLVAPINSIKHYVPQSPIGIAGGAKDTHVIIDAVAQNLVTAVEDVVEGSIIKAVFCEFWIHNETATGNNGTFTITIEKIPAGQIDPTISQMANLQSYPNKKNVLWTSQGILASFDKGQGAIPIIRTWVAIPKGKQRFSIGDRFVISTSVVEDTFRVCGMFIYKEYK